MGWGCGWELDDAVEDEPVGSFWLLAVALPLFTGFKVSKNKLLIFMMTWFDSIFSRSFQIEMSLRTFKSYI